MVHLSDLPPELVLKVLSCIPLSSLHVVMQLSRLWYQFILTHEHSIYHHAAWYHRFITSMKVSLDEAKSLHTGRAMVVVDDWRSFCRYLFCLHSTWSGHGRVTSRLYSAAGTEVHRIKADEKEGFVITTSSAGGIRVTDLETDMLLWELRPGYVRSWAHVEYGNGFLIFDRFGEYKEVWRLVDHCQAVVRPTTFPPDTIQLAHSSASESSSLGRNRRGEFEPWALLRSPEWGRAFRFVYPTLLVGSFLKAYLFDVESAQLIQTIENTQQIDGEPLGEIHYVEVNDRHVFICGSVELRIFNRTDGRLTFRMHPGDIPGMTQLRAVSPMSRPRPRRAQLQPIPLTPEHQVSSRRRYFTAVHVHDNHLAILRDDAEVVLIRDYQAAIQKKQPMSDFAVNIKIHEPPYSMHSVRAVYMAFEHGRLAIVTTAGVFVFTVDATYHKIDGQSVSLVYEDAERPMLWDQPLNILCCKVRSLESRSLLHLVSCLQMTESKLFLAYHPQYAPMGESAVSTDMSEMHNAAGAPSPMALDAYAGEQLMYDIAEDGVAPGEHVWYDDEAEEDGDNGDDEREPEARSVVCIDFSP